MAEVLIHVDRRNATAVAGAVIAGPVLEKTAFKTGPKRRLAMVGTGSRGTGMWGKDVLAAYGDRVEFVGVCDINPGRVETAKKIIGTACPTFTDFDRMLGETRPDTLIVTTVDGTHSEFIVKALAKGVEVITVCDREADIYEMFALAQRRKASLLVRASSNRAVLDDEGARTRRTSCGPKWKLSRWPAISPSV